MRTTRPPEDSMGAGLIFSLPLPACYLPTEGWAHRAKVTGLVEEKDKIPARFLHSIPGFNSILL